MNWSVVDRVGVDLAVAAVLLAGCSTGDDSAGGKADDITVFAAASLQPTFTRLGKEFEQHHPGSHVSFSFAGSSTLAQQIDSGAPADVFASADTTNMDKVVRTGKIAGTPTRFASNTLTIVVPHGNPKHIASLADLTRPGVQLVECASPVPCGAAARRAADAAHVQLSAVSEESSVTDVLGKVTSGQADAGLVYVTDAADAGDKVTSVPFAQAAAAVNEYPIAVVAGSDKAASARQFVDLVTGTDGRAVLEKAGFGKP